MNEGKNDSPHTTLTDAIESARRDWQQALNEMDHIDNSLVEYAVFKISAAEKHYVALLEQARREGIVAWPIMTDISSDKKTVGNTLSGVESEAAG